MDREKNRDCAERRRGVIYKREIVTMYYGTIKIIYIFIYFIFLSIIFTNKNNKRKCRKL